MQKETYLKICLQQIGFYSSPEPKTPGELIGETVSPPSVIVRDHSSIFLNDFSSEAAGTVLNKFHTWLYCLGIKGLLRKYDDHVTKMVSMPIHGKKKKKKNFENPRKRDP